MLTTQSLLEGYKIDIKKSRRTERGDIIDLYLANLNPPRIAGGYKPLGAAFLSRYFSERKMTVSQMYQFYMDCQRAKTFSSYFWWATKIQKETNGRVG